MRRHLLLATTIAFVLPITAWAASYDVQIQRSDVTFVPTSFVVGDHVRVYATVKNVGERDVQGNVFFSENGTAIGTPPPFSVRARGAEEEVWVDWQPAVVGERQIFIRVVTAPETRDEEPNNNEMIVPVTVRDRPPPPPPPTPANSIFGGGGAGSNASPPAGAAPSGTVTVSAPSLVATVPAPKPKAPTTSGTAIARTSDRPSAAALRPAVPAVVLAPTNTAPTAAPAASPPAPPYDEQLRQLLGRPASPWRSVLPIAAAGIAVVAAATMVALRLRRRAHDETPRRPSETVDRRPTRTS
ncbi:hypothetical protein HY634_00200 [Candidatus Uhrbacteria bacterium]|nr:hypothetical protein [Candidatus Uhrbacteria bacterium]